MVLILVAGAIGASIWVYRSQLVVVPDLTATPIEEARTTLDGVGLMSVVEGSRVSADVAVGGILAQEPAPGTSVPSGTEISLVVSAGSQTVRVPDLVGVPVDEARSALDDAGFRVSERIGSSEESRAVILEMYPAPGTLVNLGDTVRITVPGQSGEPEVLLPFEMSGVSVLVDPAPSSGGASDPALEVARRLVSLLEASGAEARLTRTSGDADATRGARVAASRESTAAVFIGFDISSGAGSGISVLYPGIPSAETTSSDAATLAKSITSAIRLPGGRVNPMAPTDDPVLGGFSGEGARLMLGDLHDAGDQSRFRDPSWADEVARSVYRALGAAYGTK